MIEDQTRVLDLNKQIWPLPDVLEKYLISRRNNNKLNSKVSITAKHQIGLLLLGPYKDVNMFLDKKKKIVAIPEVKSSDSPNPQTNGAMKSSLFDSIFTDSDNLLNICNFGLPDSIRGLFSGCSSLNINISDVKSDNPSYRGEMIQAILSWIFTMIGDLKHKFSMKHSVKLVAVKIPTRTKSVIIDLFNQHENFTGEVNLKQLMELKVPNLDRALFYLDTAIALSKQTSNIEDPILFGINLYSSDSTGNESIERLYFLDLTLPSSTANSTNLNNLTSETLLRIIQGLLSKKVISTLDMNQPIYPILHQIFSTKSIKIINVLLQITIKNTYDDLLQILKSGNRLYRCMHKRNLQLSRKMNDLLTNSQNERLMKNSRHFSRERANQVNCTSDSELSCNTTIFLEKKAMVGSRSNHLKRKQYRKLNNETFNIEHDKKELWVDGPNATKSLPKRSKTQRRLENPLDKSQCFTEMDHNIFGCSDSLIEEDIENEFLNTIERIPKPLKPVQFNTDEGKRIIASLGMSTNSPRLSQKFSTVINRKVSKNYEHLLDLNIKNIKPDACLDLEIRPKQFNKVAEWIQKTSSPNLNHDRQQNMSSKRYHEIQGLFPYLQSHQQVQSPENQITHDSNISAPSSPFKKRNLRFFRQDNTAKEKPNTIENVKARSSSVDPRASPMEKPKRLLNELFNFPLFNKSKVDQEPAKIDRLSIIYSPLEKYNRQRESIHSSSGNGSDGSSSGYQHLYNFAINTKSQISDTNLISNLAKTIYVSSESNSGVSGTCAVSAGGHTSSGYESIIRDSSNCDSISENSADKNLQRFSNFEKSLAKKNPLLESQTSSSSSTTSRRSNSVPCNLNESFDEMKAMNFDRKSLDDLLDSFKDLDIPLGMKNEYPIKTNDQILEKIRFECIYECLEAQDKIKKEIITLKELMGIDSEGWSFKPSVIDSKSATDIDFLDLLQSETEVLREYLSNLRQMMSIK